MDFTKAKKQAYNSRTKTYVVRDDDKIIGHSPEMIPGIPCTNKPGPEAMSKSPQEPRAVPDPEAPGIVDTLYLDEEDKDMIENQEAIHAKKNNTEPDQKNDFGLNWWE